MARFAHRSRPLRRRHLAVRVAALLVLALAGLAGWGLIMARSDPVVRRVTLIVDGFPRGTPPLRLALVSDIHVGNWAMPASRLERIVDQINAQAPDAVLIAGDLVNGGVPDSKRFNAEAFVAPLSRLQAPLGVWASLGNHDVDTRPREVTAALTRAHAHVLSNRAVRLGPITLIGQEYDHLLRPIAPRIMASAIELGGVPVLMSHAPPDPHAVPAGVALVLAGHTHCGQILLGPWDNSWDPFSGERRFDPRFRCGLVHTPHYTIVIGAGLGAASEIPLRINAPPDVWMITLVPRDQ
ncbi:metallophosphoesterase [Novosphingobium sp.]|uniref:metallophosphoesterase n=1 Tax=Novosphingobium sp. TaxID=1874826 RepID=UPI003340D235